MTDSRRKTQVLTFGEAMALFVADSPGALADVAKFHRRLAGADNNVAIGLSRLGFPVQWLSRIGQDSLGTFIQRVLESEKIDCRHLIVDQKRKTGLMFKERAIAGKDPLMEYFRAGSAASGLTASDAVAVDFQNLSHLHATGITPALSPGCMELSRHLLTTARASGASISFDPNLRPTLWPSADAMRHSLNDLAGLADWVLPGLAEGRQLTGLETPYDIAGYYLDKGCTAVMIKLGPEGSYYRGHLTGQDEQIEVPGFPVAEVVDTVGAGDGFAVGVISALLDGFPPMQALRRGNLIGAEAVKVSGDMEGLPDQTTLTSLETNS